MATFEQEIKVTGAQQAQAEEDRVRALLSPERGTRLLKAFRGANVQETQGIAQAATSATATDFERQVEEGRREITFREAQNTAAIEHTEFMAGRAGFTIREARRRAKAQAEADIATGRIDPISASVLTSEALEERYVLELLQRRADDLRRRGAPTSDLEASLKRVGLFDPRYGYTDQRLSNVAREIDEADRDLFNQRRSGDGRPLTVNVTHVATQFNDSTLNRRTPLPNLNQ